MTRKKTQEEFVKEVYDLTGKEYIVLGTYKTARKNIKIKHVNCGYEYNVLPTNFLKGQRCPRCNGGVKNKDTAYFKKEVYEFVKNEYEILGEYINSRTATKMIHLTCGNEFEMTPGSFLSGHRCPECAKNKNAKLRRKTQEQFELEVYELVGDEYSVLGEYINTLTKVNIRHNICNHVWGVRPGDFLQGKRCPKCAGRTRDTEQFRREVHDLTNGEYELIGEYKGNNKGTKIKHLVCGHVWCPIPSNFFKGSRCPRCKESKGERVISNWLDNYQYNYEQFLSFNDCKYKRPLPFDFAVFNDKNELILLIEYDGEQHFEPIGIFGGEKGLKQTKLRDEIKNKYCKENSIPLLRIPYWDFDNIDKILEYNFQYKEEYNHA